MDSVQKQVLEAAARIAAARSDHTFSPREIVEALPHLNARTVLTHVTSRLCANAPQNHPHKWPYFRRVGRGKYQVAAEFRVRKPSPRAGDAPSRGGGAGLRDTIHATVHKDGEWYVAECLELAVVTQGRTFEETVGNLNEALALHLDDEDLSSLGLVANPRLQIIYELPAAI
jgi:predicted RNase H-like HicB family nuclease